MVADLHAEQSGRLWQILLRLRDKHLQTGKSLARFCALLGTKSLHQGMLARRYSGELVLLGSELSSLRGQCHTLEPLNVIRSQGCALTCSKSVAETRKMGVLVGLLPKNNRFRHHKGKLSVLGVLKCPGLGLRIVSSKRFEN